MRRTTLILATVGTVAVLGAGAGYFVSASSSAPPARTSRSATGKERARKGGTAGLTSSSQPFRVVSVTPRNGADGVPGTATISVTFSDPLASNPVEPTLSPSVPGSWEETGRSTLTFTPSVPFVPLSQETLTIRGGSSGPADTAGAVLGAPFVDNFTIEDGSTLRLQQLLSLLDYSPLAWNPSGTAIPPADTPAQLAAMYSPPSGKFSWRSTGWPAKLYSLWKPGDYNVFTRGLVMSYQADHGLDVTGKRTGALWLSMMNSLAAGVLNTGGYNYAIGDKVPPESLKIWHDGRLVFSSPANTGIPQSPTPSGTFPVYARYRNEIMRGTNPDGVPYADPVQYVAYFYDGDAVHYFPRADYGVPQSLGCIELPLAAAAAAWPYLAYGTLVTVVN
jgi:hypothetical protein